MFPVILVSVQEPGQAEHPAAGSARELRPAGQMSDRLCDGVQRDHGTHLQVRLTLGSFVNADCDVPAAESGIICYGQ